MQYPATKRIEHVDEYHGQRVADPYRWLEVDVRESPEVADWVKRQNQLTFGYLKQIEEREYIERRLTELWNYPKYGLPSKRGGRYYFVKNNGLQNQSVLYQQDSLADEATVLIDPNQWSEDGTVALAGTSFSDDGRYLAYGQAEAGSDWRTWFILDIGSGRTLPDKLEWIKFSSVEWTPDGRGFFYGRYPAPESGQAFQQHNLNQRIYYHRVGTDQADDVLVFAQPDHPEWGYGIDVSEDGRYLVLTAWKGTDDRYKVFVRDLSEPLAMAVPLVGEFDYDYTFVGNVGSRFYFRTNNEAPRGRVIGIDVRDPHPDKWQQVVGQTDHTLRGVTLVGNLIVADYLEDAKTKIRLHNLDGEHVRDVELPGIGTASGFHGKLTDTETFYSFSSFATPTSHYRYDLLTGESTLLRRSEVDFDPEDYVVKQEFYESKDGTRVPMFIAHRRDLKRDGARPTLLYGYGGFNIPLTPQFSISRLQWMEMGGVFAMPNLRGGGEYGEPWHKAGTVLNKQNVFDDFIAAAEWLVDSGYTQPQKLAIQGRSNGGLLVGACLTQRPDLYGACLPGVGVMDMLRFHQFTAGRYWVDDYGSADDPEQFQALYAYSPYHNVRPGTQYPATLVTTADTDDRVVPGHSFKFAAALQAAQSGPAPTLIRIETRAGHGAGTPTAKIIEEVADSWAFLVENLDMEILRHQDSADTN